MSKYINYIVNQNAREAQMLLFGEIGYDLNGDQFAKELKSIGEQKDVNKVTIKINSVGGNVFQGYSILAAMDILRAKAIIIETECVGIAYSMAAIILNYGTKGNRIAVDYGTVMIHDPSFVSNSKEIEESQKMMLDKMTDALTSILTNNSDLEEEKVRDYMIKETTFSAKEAKKFGFIDSIKKTGKSINDTYKNHRDLMVACSKINNNNQKPKLKKMSKLTDLLGLNAEASENAIVNAVNERIQIKKDAQSLADEKTVLENKIKLLTTENTKLKETGLQNNAKALIEKAQNEGRIEEADESAAPWIEMAVKDYEGTKKLIEGLKAVPKSINDKIDLDPKNQAELVAKYEELLERPEKLENMPADELKIMEDAFHKANKMNYKIA